MELLSYYLLGIALTVARYFIMVGIPFLIFYKRDKIQKYISNKIQKRNANPKDFKREILYSIQSCIIFFTIVALILKTNLKTYTRIYDDIHTYPLWWIPVSLLLILIIHDTYFYWMHRFLHLPVAYKKAHFVHHQSVNPSPWASQSFHFIEAITEVLIVPIIVFILPVHVYTLMVLGIIIFSINVYGHLGYEIMPKSFRQSFAFEVINTSVYHNLHHSKFKGNYSLYFRFWDRLMGTEHPEYVKEYDKIQAQRFPSFQKSISF